MHVGTREITNWTWQTFWWDSNPNNPPSPSSKIIADIRPKELKGAARNYAMSLAYFMVNPNEPNEGKNIYGVQIILLILTLKLVLDLVFLMTL